MSNHELEIIEFFIKPIKNPAISAYYGITKIDGKTYLNKCCINGKELASDGLYFKEFTNMLATPGDYFPFCCSYCGDSGCANIFVPIRCFHKQDEIVLVIREPSQEECIFCEKYEKCQSGVFMCGEAHPIYRAHRFSKKQMRQALENCYTIRQ